MGRFLPQSEKKPVDMRKSPNYNAVERVLIVSIKKLVGKRIMELRKEQGYKRDDFAKKLGIPPTTLRNYELGIHEPGHSFIIQMAQTFHVSTDYLLGLSEDRTPEHLPSAEDGRISSPEVAMLRAYRRLDTHGKRMVDLVLAEEEKRLFPQDEG